jgi:hypothetical protein
MILILTSITIVMSGCYTLVRPPLSAIEADSTAVINYYHKEYHDNRTENIQIYDPYGHYSYSPYRWHMRYDWFTGNYYYDPYYYDYRYYSRDWYYYNNRYYWYRDGYWYYTPSPGSGSSGSNDSDKTPGRRTLIVPRAIGPSSAPPPSSVSEEKRYSSGSAQPLSTPSTTDSSPSSSETKSYSTPKSTSSGSSSSDSSSKETKTESSGNRRSSKPKR